MNSWIALLRGINVGGCNRLPMSSLVNILESAGCRDAATYIQSGNAVFRADINSRARMAEKIGREIEKEHGFRPAIQLTTAAELGAAIAANPYPEAVTDPKTLHLSFLECPPPQERVANAKRLLSESESMTINGSLLYLYAPEGIGRSKFAGSVERVLQVQMTGRNWRTILKLNELASTVG